MYQIRFRLGLCLRPRWGNSQRFPRSFSWILGGPTSKGREGRQRRREGEGTRDGNGRGEEGEGDGREGEGTPSGFAPPPQKNFLATPLLTTMHHSL